MPSTYGNVGYQEYRKKQKKKNKSEVEKENHNMGIRYSKYTVGGKTKEVPASPGLDENGNPIRTTEQNKPKQKSSRKKK